MICRVAPSVALFVALGAIGAPAAGDLDEIRQRGTIKVLFPDQQSPFFRTGRGEPAGFDLEVLRGFARVQGFGLEAVVAPLADLVPALLDGRGDVIAGGYAITPARQAEVRFTHPVTPQHHVVLTREPAAAIEDLAVLEGLRVGVAPSSSWRDAALAAGVAEDRLVETLDVDPAALTHAFENGEIDAAVTGLVFALMAGEADPAIQIGAFVGEAGAHGYAVRRGDAALGDALDRYLGSVREGSGWYGEVLEHFGPRAPELFRRARRAGNEGDS